MAISPGGRPMDTSPFSASRTDNWVSRAGGLPDYVRGVAHALLRKGRAKDEATAISMAVGLMKDWAAGRTSTGKGHVHPAVQAAAAKALAQWEKMRAHAHANTGEAVELSFNASAHPRVAAGNATGGQFTKGGAQPPAKGRKAPMARKGSSAKADARRRAASLRAQAKDDRVKAAALNAQVHALGKAIAARVKSAAAARKAAAGKSAAKPQTAAQAAAAAKAATSASATAKTTTAKKTVTLGQMRARRASLRSRAQSLLSEANALDKQAAAIVLSGDGRFLEMAFSEALAERVPAGKPDGGRFAHPDPVLTRHDTPAQRAKAVNALGDRQRAAVRATTLPPPGFEWGRGDRLATAAP